MNDVWAMEVMSDRSFDEHIIPESDHRRLLNERWSRDSCEGDLPRPPVHP